MVVVGGSTGEAMSAVSLGSGGGGHPTAPRWGRGGPPVGPPCLAAGVLHRCVADRLWTDRVWPTALCKARPASRRLRTSADPGPGANSGNSNYGKRILGENSGGIPTPQCRHRVALRGHCVAPRGTAGR